ncbi:MAG: phosphoribosylaminoimidazolesuccinocarboxamide synthase [Cyclobacteriaceae bacterium]|nr:phosphoribosylaminoimidazolesuccinocarboxamide synthase [Cyclobacteriaceae bacterium]
MSRPSLKETKFNFPGQLSLYKGKVRDVYYFEKTLLMVASDRISAFDVVLPKPIPYKGQILNKIASEFLNATKHIVPNWLDATPDPNVSIGKNCDAFQVEMVIRGYLTGHAWREYRDGKRMLCGVPMPDGLKENDKFPEPILTPTTKAHEGHDEDISREDILAQGIVSEKDYLMLEKYTRELFDFGTKVADERGLILVDTKYEFGTHQGEIYLIDEIHTPDSSRYFYKDGYEDRQEKGEKQKQLSKEFVRQWLIENGFQGLEGQQIPEMTEEIVNNISDRYVELYEKVSGNKFTPPTNQNIAERVETNINKYLNR